MSGYVWNGSLSDLQEEADRRRWARLDHAELAREQLAVCADTARQRYQHALEARGLSLHFSEPSRFGGRDGLVTATHEAFGVAA
jgi:hypothetical protein